MTIDFRFEWLDVEAGTRRRDAFRAAQERGEDTTLLGVLAAAAETESLTYRLVERLKGPSFLPDPNYAPDADRLRQKMQAAGIPEEHSGVFSDAHSEAHEDYLIERQKLAQSAQQYAAESGWSGAAMGMAMQFLDPITLASNAIPLGWAVKGGALKSAVRMGLAAGGTNAALELALKSQSVMREDPNDVMQAAFIGAALGAPLGGIAGGMARRAARNGFMNATLKDVQRTPEGDAKLAALNAQEAYASEIKRLPPPYTQVEGEFIPARPPVEPLPAPDAPPQPKLLTEKPRVVEGEFERAFKSKPEDPAPREPETIDGESVMVGENGERLLNPPEVRVAAEAADEAVTPDVAPQSAPEEPLKAGDRVTFDAGGKDITGAVEEVLPNGDILVKADDGSVRRVKAGYFDDESDGFIASGSIGSGQRVIIEDSKSFGVYVKLPFIGRIPLRYDLYAFFERAGENNPAWTKLSRAFIDDPVAKVRDDVGPRLAHESEAEYAARKAAGGHRAVDMSASEMVEIEFNRYHSQMLHTAYEQFDAWARRNKFTVVDKLRHENEFFDNVTRTLRGNEDVARAHPEALAVANEIRSNYKTVLAKAKAAGVEGAELISENELYAMRKFDFDKIGMLLSDRSLRPKVYQLVEQAILKVRPDLDPEKGKVIAKHFVDKLKSLRGDRGRHLGFLDDGGKARLAEILRQGDVLDDEEVESVLDWVYGMQASAKKADSGSHPRLKRRTFLDENHKLTWVGEDGAERTLSFDDLLVNDIRELDSIYTRQMVGLTELAKRGYRSKADIDNAIREAVEADQGTSLSESKIAKRKRLMESAVRTILGQPFNETELFGDSTRRALGAIRSINYLTYMAQGALASMPEYAHAITMNFMSAARRGMPAYDELMRMAADGRMPKDLFSDIKAMGIVAEEGLKRRPVWKETRGDWLEKFTIGTKNVADRGAYYMSRASGMAGLTNHQRQMISKLYVKKLLDLAIDNEGGVAIKESMRKRLASNGLASEDLDAVLERLKKHAIAGEDKDLTGIDYVAWEKESPRTYDLFRYAVHRESYRAVQEVTLGSQPPWMHSEVGKVLGQFRSFMLTAWTKQTLHGLAMRDMQMVSSWTLSSLIAGLTYAGQTAMNYAGNEEKKEKMLTPERIALAAVQRAGWSSIVPMVVDTATGFMFEDPIFSHGRTTGLAGGIAGNPTVATLDKLRQVGSAGAQSIFTDDYQFIKKDGQAAVGLIPRWYLINTLANSYTAGLPSRNTLRERE